MFNKSVNVSAAADRHNEGVILLDVRTKQEWHEVRVPGAVRLALDSIPHSQTAIQRKYQNKEVLVICRSGSRSARATSMLRSLGVEATNVKGGINAWKRKGLPVTQGA